MKKVGKRLLSVIVLLAMICALLPAMPAVAADPAQPLKAEHYFGSDTEFITYAKNDSSNENGYMVVKLVAPNGDPEDPYNNSAYRVDFGVYGLATTNSVQWNLKYDPADVDVQEFNDASTLCDFSNSGVSYLIFPQAINASWATANAGYFFKNSDVQRGGKKASVFQSLSATVNSVTPATGEAIVYLSIPSDLGGISETDTEKLGNLVAVDKDSQNRDIRAFNTTAVTDDVVYIASMYFKAKNANSIDWETFKLFPNGSNTTGSYAVAVDGNTTVTDETVFIGFDEQTYDVPITAYRTKNSSETLGSGTVTLTRGSTTQTYKISSTGKLYIEGKEASGTVALPAGTWNWTTEELGDLLDGSGTFTVADAGNGSGNATLTQDGVSTSSIKVYGVKSGGGDDPTPAGTEFTLTLKDLATDDVIHGGKVTVTVNGDPKTATLEADGTLKITTASQSSEHLVTINIPGYESYSVNLKFYQGKITSGSKEITELSLKKATTKVTIPTPDVADAQVLIKDKNTDNVITVLTPETTGGTVTADLPDGEYTAVVVAPGREDLEIDMTVDGQPETDDTAATNKVTITVPDKDNNGTPVTTDVNVTGGGATLTEDQTIANQVVVNYPTYSIVGEWKKDTSTGNVTGMILKVYLKGLNNFEAGTFGLWYDTNVFTSDISQVQVNMKSDTQQVTNLKVDGDKAMNKDLLTVKDGTITVNWRATSSVLDASTNLVQIAEIVLPFAAGVDNSNYEAKVSKDTLKEQNFVGGAWDKAIGEAFSDAYATQKTNFIKTIWRATDTDNNITKPTDHRLPAGYTTVNGFFQTYGQSDAVKQGYDTKTQVVFPYSTNSKGLTFEVKDVDDAPISGATVIVTNSDGEEIARGDTDASGKVSVTVPTDGPIHYEVTAPNYAKAEKDMTKPEIDAVGPTETVPVELISSVTHQVQLTSDTKNINLVGADAANQQDYFFDLTPAAGYKWPSGKPAGGDLTIKFVPDGQEGSFDTLSGTGVVLTAEWVPAKNAYKIPAAQITNGESTTKIMIKVESAKQPQEDTNLRYDVVVTSGNGGTFTIAETPAGSTFANASGSFTPGSAATSGTVTETLATKGTTSSKYTFTPNEPDDQANKDLRDQKKPYMGYVIDSVVINGTPVTLTNHERITGVSYQLTGIDQDQSIVVSYAKARIDGNEDIDEPAEPQSDATVTIQLSGHGAATGITVGSNTKPDMTGPDTKTYQVATGESLTAAFAGVDETIGSTTTHYEVDSVTVDGVVVFKDGAAPSDSRFNLTAGGADGDHASTGTLTLSGLAKGSNHTVVVLFKVDGSADSMFATLDVKLRSGDGTVSPMGSQIKTIGLPVKITATPADGSTLSMLDLQNPTDTAAADIKADATETAANSNIWTYTTAPLTAGTTTVGVTFQSNTVATADKIEVHLDVKYPENNSKPATFIFVDGDGNTITYSPDAADEAHKLLHENNSVFDTLKFQLPAGTWTMFVGKDGCLDYIISGIVLEKDDSTGTVKAGYEGSMNTKVEKVEGKSIVYLSYLTGENGSTSRKLVITAGDATWDGHLIAVNDIAQVASGLLTGASAEAVARADVNEDTDATVDDMTIVLSNLGRYNMSLTYSEFLALDRT